MTLNTDNRLVSNTSMPKELAIAASTFDLTPKQMKDIVLGGFKRSFFPQPYVMKRAYVRKVINYYEKLEEEYGLERLASERARLHSVEHSVTFAAATQ